MKGKIVLIPFPFTDLTTTKLRPALVINEGRNEVIVAFISSKIQKKPTSNDVLVDNNHPEFKMTGLKTSSLIRLDKIATILKELVIGELGEVGPILRDEINIKLCNIFKI